MRTLRGLFALGLLAMLSVACGGSPQPIEGHAYWQDGCDVNEPDGGPSPGGSCTEGNHTVTGDMGSSQVIIDCQITPLVGGGSNLVIVVAAGSDSFDISQQGISINGNVTGAGQEMNSGFIQVQGMGWSIQPAIGPTTNCHVFVDNLSATGVTGRFSCDEVVDMTTLPNKYRFVRGVPSFTASPNFGEFVLANCANPSL